MKVVKNNQVSQLNESKVKEIQLDDEEDHPVIRPRKKQVLKRSTTILNAGKNQDPFEDSRVTMLLFEKYKIIELMRLMLIIACTALTILEYEYTFATQITQDLNPEIESVLYIILLMTILIILITIAAYQAKLAYSKKALLVTPDANLFETKLFWELLTEIIILLPTSTPFTMGIKVHFSERYSDTERFYYVNEILTYIMLIRTYLIGDILLKFYPLYNNQVGRLCRLYSVDLNTHMILKLAIRDFPFTTISVLFMLGMFACSYTLEISERALLRTDEGYSSYTILNSFWVNMITILTVGYGDIYPITDLGRFSMFISVFYGVTLTSLFTAMLSSLLLPSGNEMLAWAVLEKADATKHLKNVSKYVLYNLAKLIFTKRKVLNEEDKEVDMKISEIESLIQDVSCLKRSYRDIDGEEFLAMVQRKFRDTKLMFEDYVEHLKTCKEQQKSINDALNRPIDFSFKSLNPSANKRTSDNKSKSQNPTGSANTYEKHSKDEHYFQLLEEQNKDPYLMNFEN